VPKGDQANIFDRFYVAFDTDYHRSSKIDYMGGGMGIGLSIVKGIIDAHHGEVWLESSGLAGEGTTFFVKLPQKHADSGPASAE
jgi:signal transduction histidine kinase